ncbi:MAG: autotransporter domain-containing protein [Kiritimatiellales bacterium]|nr:autotransporter domain-containing protein [Kiritimatiellales bacterium]
MKFNLISNPIFRIVKKVKPAAFAFFLCLWQAPVTSAITNRVTGTAFGTDYAALATAESIASLESGNGSLDIGFAGTTNISLNHDISGSISITNNFNRFSLAGTNSTITNTQSSVLFVEGGSNLTVSGGSYAGVGGTDGVVLPPLPGEIFITNAISSAGTGGLFINTTNALIEGADFSGGGYLQDGATAKATDGLIIAGTTMVITDSTMLTGGSAETASAVSQGGRGLAAFGSALVISNGTFRGGNAGEAADSRGGDAIYVTNSTIEIIQGSFTGGSGGSGGTGGAALNAEESEVHISAGTLRGGADAPALISVNSDLTVDGGSFRGGTTGDQFGLVSWADSGVSNQVVLNGGTFDSIDFSGNGYQWLTAGTNLVVEDYLVQDGGTVFVDNLSDDPLQITFIREGIMIMNTDFTLSDGGLFALVDANSRARFPALTVSSNALFTIDTGSASVDGAFNLLTGGELSLSVINGTNGALFADQASFESNSTLSVDARQANFAGNSTNQVTVITTTNGIFVAGVGATNGTVFTDQVNVQTYTAGRTVFNDLSIENSNRELQLEFLTRNLADYWGASGQLALLAAELDSNINNATMLAIIDSIDDPAQSRAAVEQAYLTSRNTFQSSLTGLQAARGHTTIRGAEFREMLKLIPPGAEGPMRRNELRGWGKGYGSYLSREVDGLNSQYDTSLYGGVIGVDKSFDNLLIGLSGGSGASSTEADSNAEEKVTTYHGSLYGTYGFDHAYIDAGVAYGFNEVETDSAAPFVMHGEFDAHLLSAYLSGGYDLIDTRGGTVFTPEASVQYSVFEQDAYTETSTTAIPRSIDAYDTYSLRASLGINTSMLQTKVLENIGFKIDGQLHWIHEFNPDPENMTFRLEGGGARFQFAPPSLDADLFRLGIGASFFNTRYHKPKNVMLRIDFAELIGEDFISHNLSAKVIYAF